MARKPSDDESSDSAERRISGKARTGLTALTIAALGVVFGDIGTSPLYAVQVTFTADNGIIKASHANIYGVISLMFWAITLVVGVKYLLFIMRADNNGEGGGMALISLVRQHKLARHRAKTLLVALGIIGVALFFGDGMITPAISVISAVEGLKTVSPGLGSFIVPISLAILITLFALQRFGTARVGRLFGPVIGVWFVALGTGGAIEIAHNPAVIRAVSPTYGAEFFFHNGLVGFFALGSVVLAVTGAEALYADLGHFGRTAISRAWFFCAFPALALNYAGQGALILRHPAAISNSFFLLYPKWLLVPMVILATVAVVIASQAVITGSYSVVRQAVHLGFLPRVRILHTSEEEQGQVYVPAINWLLLTGIIVIVIIFQSSARLANAYGLAVTGTFVITSLLYLFVVRSVWRKPLWQMILIALCLLPIDLSFFSANLRKVADGGWLPVGVAILFFTVLMTWQRGREIVTQNRTEAEGDLREFIEEIHSHELPVFRVPGTAVFLNANLTTAPLAMRANVEHNHTLHQHVAIVSVEIEPVPHIPNSERIVIDNLGYSDDSITHIILRYGFKDSPNVPAALKLIPQDGECKLDLENCSYFLSRINIVRTQTPGMANWRKKLFITIARHAANPVEYFGLPDERTVIMGGHVTL